MVNRTSVEVGKLLADLRGTRDKLTQDVLHRKSGVPQSTISAYENGTITQQSGPVGKLLDAMEATAEERAPIVALLEAERLEALKAVKALAEQPERAAS